MPPFGHQMCQSRKVELVARQFLRALRGKRSQRAFARRLGYRGNPITDWEHGRSFPTAREALRAAARVNVDVPGALARFAPGAPLAFDAEGPQLGPWLSALAQRTTVAALAERSGLSRFAIGRWLSGQRHPRLPDFFRLVDAITARVPELVAELVSIAQVPELIARYERAERARRLAFEEPWTEVILRVLESPQYRALPEHVEGYIAERLHIPRERERRALMRLSEVGLIRWDGERYGDLRPLTVDTHGSLEAQRALRHHWAEVASERTIKPGPDDLCGYNVFAVSSADYAAISERLRAVFGEIRSIVAASEPADRICLLNLQLMRWD
jgi:transcriptional regulator with XRE-family HTH domain